MNGTPLPHPRTDSENRNVAQFTLDADGFASAPIMNDEAALDALVRVASIADRPRVLDVACGPGIVATRLALAGAEVTAVDITPAMLAHARRRAGHLGVEVNFIEGSMYELPFEDGEFDIVVSRYALHHAHDLENAVDELVRVVSPTGRLVVFDFDADPDPVVAAAYDAAERARDASHARNLTAEEQHGLFDRAGWACAEHVKYRLPATVESVLAGSSGPDHGTYRGSFEASVGSHGLGVAARRVGNQIAFEFPICGHGFTHRVAAAR